MAEAGSEGFEISGVWVGVDETPIVFANQFLGTVFEGEVVLALGQATPPALLGTPEQQLEQARQLNFIPIKPMTRVAMNVARLREFIGVLQQTVENHERQEQQAREGGIGP
jgi:hypothetical protein